ncbi:sulfur carrier protein ThiS [Desulfosarcina sp. OttesenSCG-928-B08]|nr:sulfur carrier protein ThiS [Desulfosarcina sp. OttesenSCG-928-B08]
MDDTIRITVNGQIESCPQGVSVQDYLAARGVNPAEVVAERNGVILRPESFKDSVLGNGDNIEFIRFVGGG